jgi:hypothetical protein
MTTDEQIERSRRQLAKWREMEERAVTLTGGRRCAIQQTAVLNGWWASYSPRNDSPNAEGHWSDWVCLAREILAYDAQIKRGEATAHIPEEES